VYARAQILGVLGGGAAGAGLCFAAGTLVDTPNGEEPIEQLRVGDRVRTSGDEGSGATSIDPATWRDVRLRMPNPDGSRDILDIEVLRPTTWITDVGAALGQWIAFGLPEMGLYGPAEVESVSPTPTIQPGPGRVVRATVTHLNGQLHVLKFREVPDVLQPTATHRLYSIDRQAWTPTADLKTGGHLWAEAGVVTVDSNATKGGAERVYNIEVETEHSYLVGEARILSHNENPCAEAADGVGEGIYEFVSSTGKTYVGQSVDVATRLEQHLETGKLLEENIDTVETAAVEGGKLAREIAEQQRIDQLGGVEVLQNIRNPIGLARQYLMPAVPDITTDEQ
jgi:hypothetical protein